MAQAGSIIRAVDFSPLLTARTPNTFLNLQTTGWESAPPACEITFIAPTSGVVRFRMQVSFESDTANEFGRVDIELRERDSAGTLVRLPSTDDGQGIRWLRDASAAELFETRFGRRIVSRLVPGRLYWAQLQFNNPTAGIDVEEQHLMVSGVA